MTDTFCIFKCLTIFAWNIHLNTFIIRRKYEKWIDSNIHRILWEQGGRKPQPVDGNAQKEVAQKGLDAKVNISYRCIFVNRKYIGISSDKDGG